MLDIIPVWLLSLGAFALIFVSVQTGIWFVARTTPGEREKSGEGHGVVVGALLGLLAFMLAFTFGAVTSRRDARKQLFLEEVNSIGTTYLRAGLIPQGTGNEARELLRRYVDLRLEVAEHPDHLEQAAEESLEIQSKLWSGAESLADADLKNANIVSLYIDSLNETIDLQTKRITVSGYRIPTIIWPVFGGLMILSAFMVGMNFGIQSDSRQILATTLLALSFTSVMFLVFDLDRGNAGFIKLDQGPMYELKRQILD